MVRTNAADIAQSLNNRGIAHRNKGEFQLALKDLSSALETYKLVYSTDNEITADVYLNLADVFESMNMVQSAKEHLEKARSIYISSVGSFHPSLALCYNNLGNIHAKHDG